MYFLLTGHPPFPDGSIASRIVKHQNTMPPDIRSDRPDCPGELDGICVKMMQKDPKYRYANCAQVAEVLEVWLAKYRKEHPEVAIKPAKGMSIDELLEETKSRSNAMTETVNNRSAKTMDGNAEVGSGVMKLSASDSGVLRAIAKSDGSSVDSHIDLVQDSNQPNPKRSKANAIATATGDSAVSRSGASPLVKPIDNSRKVPTPAAATTPAAAKGPAAPAKPSSPAKNTPAVPKRKSNQLLLIIAGCITLLLFIAILIAVLSNR
jgi:serine/threonine-protein kinase